MLKKERNKGNSKNSGITLIALIVTIIVLLILAGVTIAAISGNEGVLQKAQTAKDKTEIANAKEQAQILAVGYLQDYYTGRYVTGGVTAANEGEYVLDRFSNTPTYGNYKFAVEGNTLKVYNSSNKFLVEGDIEDDGTISWSDTTSGEDLTPVNPTPVTPTGVTITNNTGKTTITTAENLSLTATITPSGATGTIAWTCTPAGAVTFSQSTGTNTTVTPVSTGNVTITATVQGTELSANEAITIESNRLAKYVLTLPEDPNDNTKLVSAYVNYTMKGQSLPTLCKVLYNDGTNVEIIPVNPVAKVTLGHSDSKITTAQINTESATLPTFSSITKYVNGSGSVSTGTAGTAEDYAKVKASYNNVVTNLNARAEEDYMNTELSSEARCVGSDPSAPNTDNPGYFTSTSYTYLTTYKLNDGTYKAEDTKYNTDLTQLGKIGAVGITDTTNGSYYWLASRRVGSDSYSSVITVRFVNSSGRLSSRNLCYVDSSGNALAYECEFGFRPVFKLKSTVQVKDEEGRDGTTPEKAYNLELKTKNVGLNV